MDMIHRFVCLGAFLVFMMAGDDCYSMGKTAPVTASNTMSMSVSQGVTPYQVGTGIFDITGPPAEVMFGGMVEFTQLGEGILMRQWARAFIVNDAGANKRVVYVNIDLVGVDHAVHVAVLRKLKEKYGDLYNEHNVLIQATHTHSAPGGFFDSCGLNFMMGLGFCQKNFDVITNGVFQAIVRAHNNLKDGRIYMKTGESSWKAGERIAFNRSPLPYRANPVDELARYITPDGTYDDTNRKITVLKFKQGESEVGEFNWAAVHGHISGPFLKLINGDSKGYAAYLFEKEKGCTYSENSFVASFAMNDAGDSSANLPEDAYDFGLKPEIDAEGKEIYRADGIHDYERMRKRGLAQYKLVTALYNQASDELTGNIQYAKMFVPFPGFRIDPAYITPGEVRYPNETVSTCATCSPVVGLSMLKTSSEDTKGMIPGPEGTPRDVNDIPTILDYFKDPLGSGILDFLWMLFMPSTVLEADKLCQLEKIEVLPTGRADQYLFTKEKAVPQILPIQIIKIGRFVMVGLPFEVTTMSGRRIRDEVRSVFTDVTDIEIAACANTYVTYLTTREEYALQNYEGGSNWFGPYTLNAVRQMVHDLADSVKNSKSLPSYAVALDSIPTYTDKQWALTGNVLFDDKPIGTSYGQVITDAGKTYHSGDTVTVTFWGAHPDNNLMTQSSYMTVEKLDSSGNVEKYAATDKDPETVFRWKRMGIAWSNITTTWTIPAGIPAGTYRIRHTGYYKPFLGEIKLYQGMSSPFTVVN